MTMIAHVGRLALAGLAGLALASAAQAEAPGEAAPKPARSCFYLSDWDGWSAPDKNTLLMRVRNRDVYRLELTHASGMLKSPGVHLVSVVRGVDSVCAPLDLDLRVSDGFGMAIPIRAKTITKLTPEEIAAIPKKDRP